MKLSTVTNPRKLVVALQNKGLLRWVPDRPYLCLIYWARMGRKLNLKNPSTYNEKIQWLKLYDRRPEYISMVDKYLAKKYVGEKIGEQYIIPTLGYYNSFEEIDFDKLPNQFVLKCTHDSGGVVICKDKSTFDREKAKNILEKSLQRKFFYYGREWVYKNVVPRIIAEKYMEDKSNGELNDYKFFTFNGKTKYLFIAKDRYKEGSETTFDFYDTEFRHLNIRNGHPNSRDTIIPPKNFNKMIELANILSEGTPQLRVDFYEVDGEIFFGELTFFHWSGFVPFEPEEWDVKFGELIEVPSKNIKSIK